MTYCIIGKSARIEVFKALPALRRIELRMEKSCRLTVGTVHLGPFFAESRIISVLRHGNTVSVGKKLNSLHIIEIFNISYKGYNVSAVAAPEAIIRLRFGIDGKRRCFFVVKRTKSRQYFALSFKRNIRGNGRFNIGAAAKIIKKFIA